MLSQKNDQNIEVPIAFESSTLLGAELNYTDVEKQAYAVFNPFNISYLSLSNLIPR